MVQIVYPDPFGNFIQGFREAQEDQRKRFESWLKLQTLALKREEMLRKYAAKAAANAALADLDTGKYFSEYDNTYGPDGGPEQAQKNDTLDVTPPDQQEQQEQDTAMQEEQQPVPPPAVKVPPVKPLQVAPEPPTEQLPMVKPTGTPQPVAPPPLPEAAEPMDPNISVGVMAPPGGGKYQDRILPAEQVPPPPKVNDRIAPEPAAPPPPVPAPATAQQPDADIPTPPGVTPGRTKTQGRIGGPGANPLQNFLEGFDAQTERVATQSQINTVLERLRKLNSKWLRTSDRLLKASLEREMKHYEERLAELRVKQKRLVPGNTTIYVNGRYRP